MADDGLKRFQIAVHPEHYKLLEAMASQEYREPAQQAAYLIGCSVSGWAVQQRASAEEEMALPGRCDRCTRNAVYCDCSVPGDDSQS